MGRKLGVEGGGLDPQLLVFLHAAGLGSQSGSGKWFSAPRAGPVPGKTLASDWNGSVLSSRFSGSLQYGDAPPAMRRPLVRELQ